MGTIHQLNPHSRIPASTVVLPLGTACEIVIFPGVRIERHDDTVRADPRELTGRDETDGGSRPRKSS